MCHFLLTSLPLSGSFNHWTKQAGLGLENTKETHLPRMSTAFQTLSHTAGWRRNWGHSQDGKKTVSPNRSASSFPLNLKAVIRVCTTWRREKSSLEQTGLTKNMAQKPQLSQAGELRLGDALRMPRGRMCQRRYVPASQSILECTKSCRGMGGEFIAPIRQAKTTPKAEKSHVNPHPWEKDNVLEGKT